MYKEDLLKDKVALVTGGRSGIGYAIAEQFLQVGAKVFICSRKEEPLKEAAQKLQKIGSCAYKACDIREVEQITALAQAIKEEYGRLDILVNNAGGQFPSPAEKISPNGWTAVINNNLNGTFFVTQEMTKEFFIPQKGGVILNIIATIYRGFPGMVHTGAARAGVDNMTKSLALEWSEHNIRVNSIAPGTIESSGLETYPKPVQEAIELSKNDIPLGYFGTSEDIANVACFYASPLSKYVSGTTLYVDGAQHLNSDNMRIVNTIKSLV